MNIFFTKNNLYYYNFLFFFFFLFLSIQLNAQCIGTSQNQLINPSFEIPAQSNVGNNIITWPINGWNGFGANPNIVKTNGGPSTGGPNNAHHGVQYLEIVGSSADFFQQFNFQCNTEVYFSGYFSVRDNRASTGRIDLLRVNNNNTTTLVASSNQLNMPSTPNIWYLASGSTTLTPGTYRFNITMGEDSNFDDACFSFNYQVINTGSYGPLCENSGSIILTGTPTDSFGTWSGSGVVDNGNGTAVFNPSGLGGTIVPVTYSHFNASGFGCTQSTNITVNPSITPIFTQVAPICSGTNLADLPTTSNNGIAGTWSPALNNTATTTYTFTPDSVQCATTTMTIVVDPPSILYITSNDPNCNPNTLSWSTLNNINANTATASIGTNLITINKPTGGLFSTSNVYSGNIFPPQYNLPINNLTLANNESGLFTFCFNTPVQNPQIAIASIGRPGLSVPINTSVPYQVIWAGPGMNFINNQSLSGEEGYCIIVFPGTHQCISFDYLVSENYCNIVFGTQDNNCQIEPICMGGSVELVPHGSTNVTWSPNNDLTFLPNSNHVIASPSQTTTYTITSNDLCQNQANITVTVNPNITPNFTPVANICSGATLNALPTTSNNGITGTWSPALNNTATTTYTFTPNSGQCALSQTMTITVDPLITPSFTPVADICSGATLNALPTTSNNGITGTWSPALNNTATTTYTFTPNSGQCANNFDMIIEVFDINTYPIPKGISPNGDEKNENWDLESLNVVSLKLFNRYGQLVYEKENYTNEWFGQNNTSQSLPDGTYFYVLQLKCGSKTGWVYIIK